MKTVQLFMLGFLFIGSSAKAQWVLPGNSNATSTSFIGTTATNPAAGQDVTFKRAGITAGKLQTTTTSFGVNALAMPSSVSIGVGAGQFSSGTGFNTYVGQNAGKGASATILNSGNNNTFLGHAAGSNNRLGYSNTLIGKSCGESISSGYNNTAVGRDALLFITTGFNNVSIGSRAGYSNTSGNYNTFIGFNATTEESTTGSGNIFIGHNAGFSIEADTSNRLVIGNDESNQLIWGDFTLSQLKLNGKVGIGGTALTYFGNYPTTAATVNVANYNLFVKGGILTEEVRVSLASTWADYVFAKDYKLKPLSEVEQFINKNQHLPNVPSAKQVAEEGINVGEMAKIQQEKIEELTLYIIQLSKDIEILKANAKN